MVRLPSSRTPWACRCALRNTRPSHPPHSAYIRLYSAGSRAQGGTNRGKRRAMATYTWNARIWERTAPSTRTGARSNRANRARESQYSRYGPSSWLVRSTSTWLARVPSINGQCTISRASRFEWTRATTRASIRSLSHSRPRLLWHGSFPAAHLLTLQLCPSQHVPSNTGYAEPDPKQIDNGLP